MTDEVRSFLKKVIKVAEDMRFRPELALSRSQLAELQFEHFPDKRIEAIEHLNFAFDEFIKMKMQPSLRKAQELKDSLGI